MSNASNNTGNIYKKQQIAYGVNLYGNFLLLQWKITIERKLCEEVNTCLPAKYLTDKQLFLGFSRICAGVHFLHAK